MEQEWEQKYVYSLQQFNSCVSIKQSLRQHDLCLEVPHTSKHYANQWQLTMHAEYALQSVESFLIKIDLLYA